MHFVSFIVNTENFNVSKGFFKLLLEMFRFVSYQDKDN